MQIHALGGGVLEQNLPLRQPRDVQAQPFVVGGVDEDVAVVAIDIERQEGKNVHAFGGQVIDRADQALALAVLPGRIARTPVFDVRLPGFHEMVFLPIRLEIAVEIGVGQQILRRVGAALQEVFARAGETQIALADIIQPPVGAQVAAGLVARSDVEFARRAIHVAGRFALGGIFGGDDVDSLAKGDAEGPGAGGVGCEMRSPLIARIGRGVGRVAVGGVIPRHKIGLAGFGAFEFHVQPVIQERNRIGLLAGVGAVESQRDLVPLLQFAFDARLRLRPGGGEFDLAI
ncbi:MAG: hypothetical protein BWZ10_02907 [candidate division BRC1 bacterium ADurb.BinA364]|nr:MAG: hypothetical protein BWZ10_02907 [candidate division BRC1 bacterium ADurb.BinA364]